MKIKLLGTGSAFAKKFSTSALVDSKILVDCPGGVAKKLSEQDKIDIMLITHFHADHDFDFVMVIAHCHKVLKIERPITVIAPKGAKERYEQMGRMANYHLVEKFTPNIIEVAENELANGITIDGYTIKPVRVIHCDMDCLGYIVSRGDKSVSFSGDTVLCDGVHEMIGNSQVAVVDVTAIAHPTDENVTVSHMNIVEYESLVMKYPKHKIIPTHMQDNTRKKLKELGHDIPDDNDIFEI